MREGLDDLLAALDSSPEAPEFASRHVGGAEANVVPLAASAGHVQPLSTRTKPDRLGEHADRVAEKLLHVIEATCDRGEADFDDATRALPAVQRVRDARDKAEARHVNDDNLPVISFTIVTSGADSPAGPLPVLADERNSTVPARSSAQGGVTALVFDVTPAAERDGGAWEAEG